MCLCVSPAEEMGVFVCKCSSVDWLYVWKSHCTPCCVRGEMPFTAGEARKCSDKVCFFNWKMYDLWSGPFILQSSGISPSRKSLVEM